jgi:hypothetical protein
MGMELIFCKTVLLMASSNYILALRRKCQDKTSLQLAETVEVIFARLSVCATYIRA